MPLRLSPALTAFTTFGLAEVARAMARELESIAEDHYLRPREARVLLVLSEQGAQMLGLLADRCAMDRPSTTRAVDSLVALGLAARSEGAFDRRTVTVLATPAGKRTAQALGSALRESEDAYVSHLRPAAVDALRATVEALLPRRKSGFAQIFLGL